jgi:hypothetical protein
MGGSKKARGDGSVGSRAAEEVFLRSLLGFDMVDRDGSGYEDAHRK